MSEKLLEECDSLREAVKSIKIRLNDIDKKSRNYFETLKKYRPEQTKETFEETNWNDELYLVYRNDHYDEMFYIFEDEFGIENWLGEEMWSDWGLWEYDNVDDFLKETFVVWKFHRNICKEKWESLHRNSKSFIDGWSRKREYASFEIVPSFSIG